MPKTLDFQFDAQSPHSDSEFGSKLNRIISAIVAIDAASKGTDFAVVIAELKGDVESLALAFGSLNTRVARLEDAIFSIADKVGDAPEPEPTVEPAPTVDSAPAVEHAQPVEPATSE